MGLGYLLSQQLVAAGETVLDVPATLIHHACSQLAACLKRYIAREVYNHLPRPDLAVDSP